MTDFSRYMIATDLDGTFFGPDGKFVERNLAVVERFKAWGGLFTLATGRVNLNIRNAIGCRPEKLINAPAVMSNGGYLYDFTSNQALEEEWMNEGDVRELVPFFKQHFPDLGFRVSTPDSLLVETDTGMIGRDLPRYDVGVVKKGPIESFPMNDWYKIVFRGEPDRLQELRLAVMDHFGQRLGITASGTHILELQPPTCNKARGLEKLRRVCGGDRILIACGDFENDIEMLQAADIAICPENASPRVKEICHYTLCHCKDGLIGDVIEGLERGDLQA